MRAHTQEYQECVRWCAWACRRLQKKRLLSAYLRIFGVALGQSLQVWHDYFEHANVWGVDIHPLVIKRARRMFAEKPRVHILRANSKSNDVKHLGLSEKR